MSKIKTVTKKAAGLNARVCAVVGGQWGDEGKGKLSDVLAKGYDIVARYNGGNNAGHTVVANGKKYAFHLIPCGIIYPHTTNILGNGTVIHLPSMFEELEPLTEDGLEWEGRLLISDRAHLLFDFHQSLDGKQEEGRGDKNIGTTKKGIGPCYATKASRTGIRAGMLKHFDVFEGQLRDLLQSQRDQYGLNVDVEGEVDRYRKYAEIVSPWVVNGPHFINEAYGQGKSIIAEGANAAMLDLDFGTYPFVTSSTTTAGGMCTGLGLSPDKIETTVGVVKAYTTRVGWGPFPTELTDDTCGGMVPRDAPGTAIGRHMQVVGAEIGVTTGRKRRCGWLDIPVVQYGHMINNYGSINLTKLDVLDELDEIKIGVSYKINGRRLAPGEMPSTLEDLYKIEVEYETMPGWKTSLAGVTEFDQLPQNAQNYIERIEDLVGCPVAFTGVGVGREDMAARVIV
jgi:adenylosuccinate synthase